MDIEKHTHSFLMSYYVKNIHWRLWKSIFATPYNINSKKSFLCEAVLSASAFFFLFSFFFFPLLLSRLFFLFFFFWRVYMIFSKNVWKGLFLIYGEECYALMAFNVNRINGWKFNIKCYSDFIFSRGFVCYFIYFSRFLVFFFQAVFILFTSATICIFALQFSFSDRNLLLLVSKRLHPSFYIHNFFFSSAIIYFSFFLSATS